MKGVINCVYIIIMGNLFELCMKNNSNVLNIMAKDMLILLALLVSIDSEKISEIPSFIS